MQLKSATTLLLLGTTAVLVRGRPQAANEGGCGIDREGVRRQVGDSWSPDGCNNCRCLPSGIPGCTRRICSNAENWEEGRTCSEGKTWEEKTGQNLKVCTCIQGTTSCTDKVTKAITLTAQCGEDSDGNPRRVGDAWKEECNNCRCATTGISLCTQRFCIDVETFRKDQYLFTVDSGRNTEDIIQCRADGARNCKAVRLDPSQLTSSPGSSQFLNLLPGSEVELQVVRRPADLSGQTLNYQFSLTDGGSGSLTYRPSTSAVYGSFKPISGSVHYELQSCGDGCNVIYERDSNYFNQFED